jgi:hypothetical protein
MAGSGTGRDGLGGLGGRRWEELDVSARRSGTVMDKDTKGEKKWERFAEKK